MKTIKFYQKTNTSTDPDQLLRMYWPGEVLGKQEFYDCNRGWQTSPRLISAKHGWQISAVVMWRNRELADQHDKEMFNMLVDCDEQVGEINITVK